MTGLIERTLGRLEGQLPGRVSRPLDNRYIAATALWAKPIGRMPRAVAHCRTPQDVQLAILAARDAGLSLSVRGGGHDWAGRAPCDGLVIDLSGMNDVLVDPDHLTARISGWRVAAVGSFQSSIPKNRRERRASAVRGVIEPGQDIVYECRWQEVEGPWSSWRATPAPTGWKIEINLAVKRPYCGGVDLLVPCINACISSGVRRPSLLASIALKMRSWAA